MNDKELRALSKLLAQEIQLAYPHVIGGVTLPTFDISATSSCCEGHCPCDSRNGGDCPCNSKCACDGKIALTGDPIDWLYQLSALKQDQVKSVLDAIPVLFNLRFQGRHSPELERK